MSQLIEKALALATQSHRGQIRKYTAEPYIVHPIAVAKTVSLCDSATAEMICAALLHDVVEDTECELGRIAYATNITVAELVNELTKKAELVTPNAHRADRKAYEAARLTHISPAAQTIKVADLIDNTKTIVAFDRNFAKVYLAEKHTLLYKSLLKADPLLLHLAREQLDASYILLEQL